MAAPRWISFGFLCVLPVATATVGCAADADGDGSTDDSVSSEVTSAALRREDLPRGGFRTRAEELGQEWIDGNIMTGDARLDAGVLRGKLTDDSLAKLAQKMVSDHLKNGDSTLRDPKVEHPRFSDALIKRAARVVAVDGFVLNGNNPRNIEPIEENIRELTRFLGSTSKLDALTLKGKATGEDEGHDDLTLFLFVNRETKQFVAFYAREGTV